MPNKSRNKANQPPSGEGKKQSPELGQARKLDKRSEVLQARPNHPELNVDDSAPEPTEQSNRRNPTRPKAGR
jgi:hypothetical protein